MLALAEIPVKRRTFLAAVAAAQAASSRLPVAKGVYFRMLPRRQDPIAAFHLAKEAGFDAVECPTAASEAEAHQMLRAAKAAGIRIHSVLNQTNWQYPLSSGDARVAEQGIRGLELSLQQAQLWGADTVLVVPAVVDASTGYREALERSQRNLRRLLPLAEKLQVTLAIENVWNKFLLSPLEFASYVDSFRSPWVRAYFDVGNVLLFGFPQDWIRVLGRRIVKLHLKDFSFRNNVAEWKALGEGEVDWTAVYRALVEIGFRGVATCELPGGELDYLREVSRRMDQILQGSLAKRGV